MAITVYKRSDNKANPLYDVRCLSTDAKPTADIPNGSTCIEIDTGKKYLFDGAASTWHEVSSSTIVSATGVDF